MTSGGTHPGPRIQNYGTPDYIVHGVVEDELRGAFDMDVCAEAWSAKAPRWIGLPRNGLEEEWGEWNWNNPPYNNQEAWLQRAAWWAENERRSTASLVRVSTESLYWFRTVELRGTCDFYIGRIAHIAPPEGVTLKHWNKKQQRHDHVFIPGGEPVPGTSFASALVLHGPGYRPGVVRWRDATTGRLIDVKRARELREMELSQ